MSCLLSLDPPWEKEKVVVEVVVGDYLEMGSGFVAPVPEDGEGLAGSNLRL